MAAGLADGDAVTRSRCRVAVRAAEGADGAWGTHEFEVWSGGGEQLVCRAAALRMRGSLLLWLGAARASLGGAALALAGGGPGGPGGPGGGTPLLAGAGAAEALALARRLAAALRKPVFVFCGASFDRFTLPLVERGIVAEIKSRPECF